MHKETNESTLPTVVILADQTVTGEMTNIFGKRETASLIVAGNSVVEHLLIELSELKFRHCIVLAQGNAKALHTMVNNRHHWGLDMKVDVMNYTVSKQDVLKEFKSLSEPNGLLVVEANCVRSHCVEAFLTQCENSDYVLSEAVSGNQSLGLTLLKPTKAQFVINPMPICMDTVLVNDLSDPYEFHRANFDVLNGLFEGVQPSVKRHSKDQCIQHWDSYKHKNTVTDHQVMIDRHALVNTNVALNRVILNHDVYVHRHAQIENTVIMPNVVVPATQKIENAIINNNTVYMI